VNFKYALLILLVFTTCEENNNSNCDFTCVNQFLLDDENGQCICNFDSDAELILNENNCECYNNNEWVIGQWQLTKYYAVNHPFDLNQGVPARVEEVRLANNNNTEIAPGTTTPKDNPGGYCYEFEIDQYGLINENSYEKDNFNYFFEG